MTPAEDPVLQRLRQALEAEYGPRLERVVLFGSRARGEAGPESDYDVAVFLRDMRDWWDEAGRLARLQVSLMEEFDAFIELLPRRAGTLAERSPLMHEIRRDGIAL
ncbi:nucleotidyltransferase family protein [Paracraurococcus lichenis]|uniref:Nucleotidyltransferase domain-containing protein n=1 Tax=Paracraurococcus lichenis TaxID=3064888 RepID=A0ABT9DUN4_9PROT|nr:nucleotidyltransferase domain-containing protein [Paracraurococcus sp. LOR1-02]MDO9707593.1 nucleotidyltransferase domain-containing protein [Paracraurococcus sp. LOR1-02]